MRKAGLAAALFGADAREDAGGVHFKRVAAQKRHEADIKLS